MILNVNTKPLNSYGVPNFTYTGTYEIVDDNDNPLTNNSKNWKIRFLTSGDLVFTKLKGAKEGIEVFLVGGGGAGAKVYSSSGGGGSGGEVSMQNKTIPIEKTTYSIKIGGGSSTSIASSTQAGSSSAFGFTARGGYSASYGSSHGASPGSVGDSFIGGGSAGGDYGRNGAIGVKEFGVGPKYYAGGGGGGNGGLGGQGGGGAGGDTILIDSSNYQQATNPGIKTGHNGTANTGGGGGGAGSVSLKNSTFTGTYNSIGGYGGSGIVIVRNVRTELLWGDTQFSGTVNATDSLNVRNIPSSTASGTKVNGTLAYQRKVKVHDLSLDTDSSKTFIWAKIQESDVSGWCNSDYLTINAQGIINKTEGAIIYSSASTSGSMIVTLPLNTIVYATRFIKGNNLIWAKIKSTYNGTTYNGYVLREHINFSGS